MVSALLSLILTAELHATEALPQQRARPRIHASVGGGASGVLGVAAGGGLSFNGEVGVQLGDTFSILARGGASTTVVFGAFFHGGLGVAAGFGEHLLVGLGTELAAFGYFSLATDQLKNEALLFPLRVSFSPGSRDSTAVARKGLQLSAEVAPGLTLRPVSFAPFQPGFAPANQFAIAASLWVSYAWW